MKKILVMLLAPIALVAHSCCFAETDFEKIQSLMEPEQKGENLEINLPDGHFKLERGLIINLDDVHIKGSGVDETILDFSTQIDGAPGVSLNGKRVTISNLTILNSAGDGIKASNSEYITFKNLKVGWETERDHMQGNYGIYPISSKNLHIDSCETFGATEAGIYVGQSENSSIVNNISYDNTVGIESENSINTKIKDNQVSNNSIGIMISDIPGLPVFGSNTKIVGNIVENNNKTNSLKNSSHLSYDQSGLGVLLIAVKIAEVQENDFKSNDVSDLVVLNYTSTNFVQSRLLFDPNVRGVKIGVNKHQQDPLTQSPAKLFQWSLSSNGYTVLWDGRVSESTYYESLKKNEHFCLEKFVDMGGVLIQKTGDAIVEEFDRDQLECL